MSVQYSVEYHGRSLDLSGLGVDVAFGQSDLNFPRVVTEIKPDGLHVIQDPVPAGQAPLIHLLEEGSFSWGAFVFMAKQG